MSDYKLSDVATERARQNGWVNAQWFTPDVSRPVLKNLMQRNNKNALRDTALWLILLIASGTLMAYCWLTMSNWVWLWLFIYSALYGGSSDSRWHEFGHGTPFKDSRINPILYQLAAFMVLRRPTRWRWSHARHHSETLIRGRDPEIALPVPPVWWHLVLNLLALHSGTHEIKEVLRNAMGKINKEEQSFIPKMEWSKVISEARVWLCIWLLVAALVYFTQSWIPILLVGAPSFLGAWLYTFFGLTQHAGMPENVLDHRKNCRTVMMNPVFRFLYWNMNYHLEHHLFPMVPYHALPRLHTVIATQSPTPYTSIWAAYREIIPTVWRQAREPNYAVTRFLPVVKITDQQ